jgi:hypothetical protein
MEGLIYILPMKRYGYLKFISPHYGYKKTFFTLSIILLFCLLAVFTPKNAMAAVLGITNTTSGIDGNSGLYANIINCTGFATGSNSGVITDVNAYMDQVLGTSNVRYALYSGDATSPQNLIWESAVTPLTPANAYSWFTIQTGGVAFSGGGSIWICENSDSSVEAHGDFLTTEAQGMIAEYQPNNFGSFPQDPSGFTLPNPNVQYIMYVNYISNNNTPEGTNVSYSENSVSLNYSEVTSSGNTAITSSASGSQPPTGFRLGNPPTYYNISTTATFTGNVEVCITYDQATIQGAENQLKLMHFTPAEGWTNTTTSLDTNANIICGITTSFSDFAVMTAPTIGDLIVRVEEMNLHQGIENSLDAKLAAAQDAINANNNGQYQTAISKLNSFITEVEAQRGNKLTNSQADELHAFAINLINLIQGTTQF